MFSVNEKKCDKSIKLVIDDETIDEVKNTKFLGVIIDKKLTWKDHINYVAAKVSRAIGMIAKAKKYLRQEAILTLSYSFVYPYLIYWNHIWGATYVFNLRKPTEKSSKDYFQCTHSLNMSTLGHVMFWHAFLAIIWNKVD